MDVYRSIVITGGGGMLAQDLLAALRLRGYAPVAVARGECDITRKEHIVQLFETHRPTLLLNCAAHTGVDLAETEPERANAINGDALTTIAAISADHETKLVHFSTDFVFDGQLDRPYRPEDFPNPLAAYGSSKLLGETNIKRVSPAGWLVIRTSWLFGRYGNCFPQTILKLARACRPLRVVNDQWGCPTFTVDLADATLRLIDHNAAGVFHVTNSGVTNWYEFATELLRQEGLSADLAPVSTADWLKLRPNQARRPMFSAMDGSAYVATTGSQMRHWSEALQTYCASLVKVAEMS